MSGGSRRGDRIGSARTEDPPTIAVFAKAPNPGEVKTRLVPRLGADGAARLHAALVRRALSIAARAAEGDVELWCSPDEHHPFFQSCAREYGVALHRQCEGDLGARMSDAFERAFARGASLVVIGTDCPALDADRLAKARAALAQHDAVLVPAEDGGYVLIGLARPAPFLFEDVPWGTARVLAETRRRIAAAALDCLELPALWDVDRPEDYERLKATGILGEALA